MTQWDWNYEPDEDTAGQQSAIDATVAPLREQLERQARWIEDRSLDDGVAAARQLLRGTALEEVTEHPEFELHYRAALATLTPEQRRDPEALEGLAAFLFPRLAPGRRRATADDRDEEPHVKAGMSRGTWEALSGPLVSIDDYERALQRDARRAERRGRR